MNFYSGTVITGTYLLPDHAVVLYQQSTRPNQFLGVFNLRFGPPHILDAVGVSFLAKAVSHLLRLFAFSRRESHFPILHVLMWYVLPLAKQGTNISCESVQSRMVRCVPIPAGVLWSRSAVCKTGGSYIRSILVQHDNSSAQGTRASFIVFRDGTVPALKLCGRCSLWYLARCRGLSHGVLDERMLASDLIRRFTGVVFKVWSFPYIYIALQTWRKWGLRRRTCSIRMIEWGVGACLIGFRTNMSTVGCRARGNGCLKRREKSCLLTDSSLFVHLFSAREQKWKLRYPVSSYLLTRITPGIYLSSAILLSGENWRGINKTHIDHKLTNVRDLAVLLLIWSCMVDCYCTGTRDTKTFSSV